MAGGRAARGPAVASFGNHLLITGGKGHENRNREEERKQGRARPDLPVVHRCSASRFEEELIPRMRLVLKGCTADKTFR